MSGLRLCIDLLFEVGRQRFQGLCQRNKYCPPLRIKPGAHRDTPRSTKPDGLKFNVLRKLRYPVDFHRYIHRSRTQHKQ